ncbi:MAG: phosphatidate cytidylyltransferase [Christensenellales bacterium]|jgi:phosphatidate cytidylyltransferase
MKKLLKKTIQGLVLFAFFLLFIFLTSLFPVEKNGVIQGYYGQIFFDILVILVMGASTSELILAVKKAGFSPAVIPLSILVAITYPLINFLGQKGFIMLMIAGITFIFIFYIFDRKLSLKDMFVSLFIFVYPILIFGLAIDLIAQYGMIPLLIALSAAMASDVFAFYFGSLIKGPKIFPRISPKKTWAGSLFGILGGALGSLGVYGIFEVAKFPINNIFKFAEFFKGNLLLILIFYGCLGAGIAFISEIGDIFASRIKRELGLKDFGTLLKDHGGVIDRIDSIMFAVLVVSAVMMFLN